MILHQQKKKKLHFEREKFERRKFTNNVSPFISKCALCDIVDITALAINLEEIVSVMKDGKELRLRKGSTDKMAVAMFESLIKKMEGVTTLQI